MPDEQLPIWVSRIAERKSEMVALSDLPQICVELDAQFRISVERWGVLAPITLVENGNGKRVLADGRRRIAAARLAGLTDIPAEIVKVSDELAAQAFTCVLNEDRSPNAMSELDAIMTLMLAGHTSFDVLRSLTGMNKQAIRKRLQLYGLSDILKQGIRDGKISTTTAEKLSKLGKEHQAKAEAILLENGRLTGRDVSDLSSVSRSAFQASLPSELFEDTPRERTSYTIAEIVGQWSNTGAAIDVLIETLEMLFVARGFNV